MRVILEEINDMGKIGMTQEVINKLNIYADAFNQIRDVLNERDRRLFLAETAIEFGYGATSLLSRRTGVAISTIRRGIAELSAQKELRKDGRVRRVGAGRKAVEKIYPDIVQKTKELLDDETYGSPEGGKWISCSLRNVTKSLAEKGISVEKSTVQRIVKDLGYSRQKNRKMEQVGVPHPDRNAQFEFIHSETNQALDRGTPVISVDTKKKENIGNFKNDGTEYRASGCPRRVLDHDFFVPELGKVAPYGVYVLNDNTAFVNLGTSADTGAFSVESIRRWWYTIGKQNFEHTDRLVVTCDCGGSNGFRNRLWKLSLAVLADEIGKEIEVIHYPPGTSKYNKVEHRLFCYITKHWQGKPFVDVQTVVNLIQSTTTDTGLSVACKLDKNIYETGIKVPDKDMDAINIEYIGPHQGWAYIIKPNFSR